jgi:hypothetical protein
MTGKQLRRKVELLAARRFPDLMFQMGWEQLQPFVKGSWDHAAAEGVTAAQVVPDRAEVEKYCC